VVPDEGKKEKNIEMGPTETFYTLNIVSSMSRRKGGGGKG
jgi:hypothetical protein